MPEVPKISQPAKEFVEYKKKKNSITSSITSSMNVATAIADKVIDESVDKVLDALDRSVLVQDPYKPKILGNRLFEFKKETWEQVKESLQEVVVESVSMRDKSYRKRRLRHWAAPPKLCPNMYTWLRAKFLYSINPADGSRWRVFRDPIAVFFFLLTVCPSYAIHIWAFALLFLFIDKRDEYQLVWFILKFKMTQAVSIGTYLLAKFALFAYECLYQISLETELESQEHQWCVDNAPGHEKHFMYDIAMEPVRIVLVWMAFYLLWSGYARGGPKELKALEHVRLDAADGALDGKTNKGKLDRDFEQRTHGGKHDDDLYNKASESARRLYQAPIRIGGALRYFLIYDMAIVIILASCLIVLVQKFNQSDFVFRMSL